MDEIENSIRYTINNMVMKKVLILLSTYNGEKYLREQLDSIIRQKDVKVTLLVRDDGSKDSTRKILGEYMQKYPSMFIIEKGENVGCRMSFFWLIKKAADNYPDFDYYAFADQDDVWLEDKMISGVNALDEIDNPYKVYYCSYQMVDENLKEIPTPHNKHLGTLEEAFIFQPCLGCCMMFSRELIEKAAMVEPEVIKIHDAWVYLLNLALSGKAIQDLNRYILYRQHSSNTIGSNQSFIKKWKRRFKSFRKNDNSRSLQAGEIMRVYGKELKGDITYCLDQIASYKNSVKKKLKIITSKKYKSNKPLHNFLFKFAILSHRI